jgi:hypothetical protein
MKPLTTPFEPGRKSTIAAIDDTMELSALQSPETAAKVSEVGAK